MGKRKLRWACLRCEAEYESRPPACGSCHLGNMLVPMPTRVAGRDMGIATRRRGGTVKAADMSATGRSAPYGEPWSNWRFGDPHTPMGYGFAASQTAFEGAIDFNRVQRMMEDNQSLRHHHLSKHLQQ